MTVILSIVLAAVCAARGRSPRSQNGPADAPAKALEKRGIVGLRLVGHAGIVAALRHHSRNPHRPVELLHTI
ncbi:hypothetical protein [Prescottella sp. R16]|uniref:hypothetical protein n=1 Tax=Prescottella sp. R16 TaxID=3064529 RepID=UPI00272EA6ED|nr:hypothetical protein [Prescottella sp. R16]